MSADDVIPESLHAHPLSESEWWACQHPERPYSTAEVFDERCEKCILKAKADLYNVGDLRLFDVVDRDDQKYMLSDLAAGRVPWTGTGEKVRSENG